MRCNNILYAYTLYARRKMNFQTSEALRHIFASRILDAKNTSYKVFSAATPPSPRALLTCKKTQPSVRSLAQSPAKLPSQRNLAISLSLSLSRSMKKGGIPGSHLSLSPLNTKLALLLTRISFSPPSRPDHKFPPSYSRATKRPDVRAEFHLRAGAQVSMCASVCAKKPIVQRGKQRVDGGSSAVVVAHTMRRRDKTLIIAIQWALYNSPPPSGADN